MLTGKLVRLRPLEPSDAEAVWRWSSDPEVGRWMVNGYPESFAQVTKRFEERPPNSYQRVSLGIEPLTEQRLIGAVRLRDAEPESGRAELDIEIGERDHWGHGYGTDAMRVICRYGIETMRLHLIALWVVADHVAARRVYQKVGFVEDGRHRESFRRDGKWHDMILMSLLEGELRE
ncbi:MAG: GNAT family N-acetyltransferase [Pseudonocardiaceae bacterium]|nr:GNAT family N-acetyltransferase [Pseudonocardiaceae bacterium]